MGIIDTHLRGLLASPRPGLLTLGLFVALYTASLGVDSVRKALNRAYDVKESRPFWKTQLMAFGMTAGGGLLVLIGITLLIAGGSAGFWAARHLGIGDEYILILRWIRWPITAALIILCVALTYYVLPDVKQEFRFITPGSIIGVIIWFMASWAFSTYVSHFGSYNVTYGSIGGVIVLMTWFYITGIILILGGEINAIIEDAATTGKASGARTAFEVPPPPGERPSAMPVGAASSASVAERTSAGSPKQGGGPATEMSSK